MGVVGRVYGKKVVLQFQVVVRNLSFGLLKW
jgi:hypothetical protein